MPKNPKDRIATKEEMDAALALFMAENKRLMDRLSKL
jgi:hypothetical protein